MSRPPVHIDFRDNTQQVAPHMPASIQRATAKFFGKLEVIIDEYGRDRWETLRQTGHELRLHTITHLDYYLALLEQRVTEAGGHVHWACDAEEARRIVLEIAQQHGVRRTVKVKSMATEEINLNEVLQAAGIAVRETDLGEYIVQLAGVMPSHIIAPAVHLTKEEIAELFHEKLGVDAPPEPTKLTEIARGKLREEFLAAEMGISGGNFLVAETGTLVLVTNEGNGRMCTTLPPLHVAVVGIEKVVPDLEGLSVMLQLLPRSGTGQKLTAYTTLLTGPTHAKTAGERGAEEFHLVLLDNGRSRILADEATRQTLLCIRCGACLNVCPVYNNVGGHAYGWVYPGPIGAILAPQLLGTAVAGDLPFASSLCGACADVCPVKIPIPDILLHLRRRVVEGDETGPAVLAAAPRLGGAVGSAVMAMPRLYEFGTQFLRLAQAPLRRGAWLPALPPPASRWTDVRPFMAFDADFRRWWRQRTPLARARERRRRFGLAIGASLVAVAAGLLLGRYAGRRRRS
jgi:L-lactate dehydrogenase complex protein LldF